MSDLAQLVIQTEILLNVSLVFALSENLNFSIEINYMRNDLPTVAGLVSVFLPLNLNLDCNIFQLNLRIN